MRLQPRQRRIDAQYTAFKNQENSITLGRIWQINDPGESGMNWGGRCRRSVTNWSGPTYNFFS